MARKEKLDLLGVSAFCESLGMMVKAGIPVSEAIGLMRQKDEGNGLLEENIASMQKSLEEGNTLQAAMEKIEKNFGRGSIMKLGDDNVEKVEVIPSGSIGLNAALGVGGYPKGRIMPFLCSYSNIALFEY